MLYWGLLLIGSGWSAWFGANAWELWTGHRSSAWISINTLLAVAGLWLAAYAATHG